MAGRRRHPGTRATACRAAAHPTGEDKLPAGPPAEPGLRYVDVGEPGITRRRSGRGLSYRWPDGALVREPAVLRRIRAIATPPAWREVWICSDPAGHIQAYGRDARGRKQYRYHSSWRERNDAVKYARLVEFGRALPAIRRQVDRDLARPGIAREKVIAAVVRLLDATSLRVGNRAYARENRLFGLTTLRNRSSYIAPAVLEASLNGTLGARGEGGLRRRGAPGTRSEELALINLLEASHSPLPDTPAN